MGYETYIVLAVILLVVGVAVGYIIKEKKNGVKCVGCPHAKSCGKKSCNNKKSIS